MKLNPGNLILLTAIITSIYAFSDGNLTYSQYSENSFLDSVVIQNTNLTLGKPFYIEKFEIPKSQNINQNVSVSPVYSFEGNGTINNLQITAKGIGDVITREDGTSSVTGRALFTSSENGTASYSFEAITNTTQEDITTSLGSAFFDANATGNLESLKSIVGIYESYIDEREGKGIFVMWQLTDLLNK